MNSFIPVCEPYLAGKEKEYVMDCLETGWISSAGKYVTAFEKEFAAYCGASYAVGVCNGTVALHLALVAMGIGEGDEVIIPNFTMIATAFAVCQTGAMPVFIDADPDTWNIDVSLIEEKITPRTKAILPVSIFGQPCDMDAIQRIASKYKLLILEDAAESHGAVYKGRKTGNLADVTTFSFFANKNLTTGEGGMVLTNDESIYKKLLYYKNLCFPLEGPRNYLHEDIGFNYRMTNIQAAIGLAQVERADYYKSLRIQNAQLYQSFLQDIPGIQFQQTLPDVENVFWMNAILVDESAFGKSRDELMQHLKQKGIDTRLLFVGMNHQPSLRKYGCDTEGYYRVTEQLTKTGLYLPSASNLSEATIRFICDEIIAFSKTAVHV
ncbi:GDP-perosamine synthase RfbE/PerA [Flavihumibacter cheonanensis]|uniref:DegT/DnrJ/EryC1/StrS family aminotransferase n=1 Tax=Flavihumibacter cheonanensis TaxID=1442385 RepID=UPI001EF89465|nr:DegT/DnrJ/EryC1/StrS family aminotransferase [Flavihumibacter cheonanensis]MCG7752774.1 DegT/DnrJ/EryC1/StrS family aminotransferase [Flavihumibacter cheonanensis]